MPEKSRLTGGLTNVGGGKEFAERIQGSPVSRLTGGPTNVGGGKEFAERMQLKSRSDELLPLPSRAAGLASRADAIADRAHEAARQDAVRSARNDASPGWLTNDPEAAKKLRKIDAEYERARAAASGLPLAEKVEAYRKAKEVRQKAYDQLHSARGDSETSSI
jgi:hypothetical protein